MAHTHYMLDKQDYTHARKIMHMRTLPSTRARTHASVHTHTHTDKYVVLIAFLQQQ